MRKDVNRRAILDAALVEFLENGYVAAGMDRIAAGAGVSKVTVYAHFADKRTLFEAVFTSAIATAEHTGSGLVEVLAESDDLARDLRAFAREHIVTVTAPHLVQLRRILIGEAGRFPELARAWHRAAPQRAHAVLATAIARLTERGVLRVADPLLAAQHLNYLILSIPLNEAMFAVRESYPVPELHRWADEAVRVFLAAYTR
ncbi:DNA-binding transcriptional regulator, AcrR family [Micromonospora phaseoli]|uniref:DNA-binding transcriptional regulator, AcrR family n=1 Tax=Micromonospora phaseoli TaxID=1144548 RepID=A0A1H7D6Q0_9ACTN|nr:TetR/AcrR family transcriptional regulator [Micromonospora phaseoli]PZV90781.1 TetR family transcriptional regulator [Micromonospora phaseoli]GIJ77553.1 TetR family transcriptional regulator [Micromonospora phaseoli]SEJ97004.1 DNA-binding transcriptional regulator, AcrR family [Micromonospora phaseoli]